MTAAQVPLWFRDINTTLRTSVPKDEMQPLQSGS